MNIPGFGAERSLYTPARSVYRASQHSTDTKPDAVVPMFMGCVVRYFCTPRGCWECVICPEGYSCMYIGRPGPILV